MTWAGESTAGSSGIYVFAEDGSPGSLTGPPNSLVGFNDGEPITRAQGSLTGVHASANGVTVGDVESAVYQTINEAVVAGENILHIVGSVLETTNTTVPSGGLFLYFHDAYVDMDDNKFVFNSSHKEIHLRGRGEVRFAYTISATSLFHDTGQLGVAVLDGVNLRNETAFGTQSFVSRGDLVLKNMTMFLPNAVTGFHGGSDGTKLKTYDVIMSGGGINSNSLIAQTDWMADNIEWIGQFDQTGAIVNMTNTLSGGRATVNNMRINTTNTVITFNIYPNFGSISNVTATDGQGVVVILGRNVSNIDLGDGSFALGGAGSKASNVVASGGFNVGALGAGQYLTNSYVGDPSTQMNWLSQDGRVSNSTITSSTLNCFNGFSAGTIFTDVTFTGNVTVSDDNISFINCNILGDFTINATADSTTLLNTSVGGTYTDNGTNTSSNALPLSIDDLTDVDIVTITPSIEDVLVWDGTNFIPSGIQVGGSSVDYDEITGDADFIPFNSGLANPAYGEGRVFWDQNEHALSYYNDEPDVSLQIGQETYVRVYNETGATLSNGTLVYVSGVELTEGRPAVGLASSASSETSAVLGWATHDIENDTYGYVTNIGLVNDINLSGIVPGSTLYLSDAPGEFIATTPTAGQIEVIVGYSITSGNPGRVLANIRAGINTAIGDASQVIVPAEKASAGTINPGDAVYVAGWNNGAGVLQVELADASSAGTMPAFGIARDTITQNTIGDLVVVGNLAGLNTSAYSEGDDLYVSETAGALTDIKPTGIALVQKVAIVARSNASNGIIEVFGAGRSNDLPNLPPNYIWVGDINGVPSGLPPGSFNQVLKIDQFTGEITWADDDVGDLGFVSGPQSGTSESGTIPVWVDAFGSQLGNTDVRISDSGNIENPRLVTFRGEYDNGNSGATATINWNEGQKQAITLNNSPTLTFVHPPEACNVLLRIIQDGTGNRNITWPTGVLFPGGQDPNLTNGGGAIDIVSFYYDGLQYYGVDSSNFS